LKIHITTCMPTYKQAVQLVSTFVRTEKKKKKKEKKTKKKKNNMIETLAFSYVSLIRLRRHMANGLGVGVMLQMELSAVSVGEDAELIESLTVDHVEPNKSKPSRSTLFDELDIMCPACKKKKKKNIGTNNFCNWRPGAQPQIHICPGAQPKIRPGAQPKMTNAWRAATLCPAARHSGFVYIFISLIAQDLHR
jgi:hypothetical protein